MEDILSEIVHQLYNEKTKVVLRHSLSARIFITAWRKGTKLSFYPGRRDENPASKFRLDKFSCFIRSLAKRRTPLDTLSVCS